MSAAALKHIKETCLYVSDLDRTTKFYHGLLGLPVKGRVDDRHVFFEVGNCMLLCFIAETSKQEQVLPPHFATGKQHMAFGISLDEYQDWKDKIEKLGIEITYEHHWRGEIYSFYFNDPDANVIEIVPNELWD